MCKLCEDDKDGMMSDFTPVKKDRLAVLEKDHKAMERLRNGWHALACRQQKLTGKRYWYGFRLKKRTRVFGDPTDAILAVADGKKEE